MIKLIDKQKIIIMNTNEGKSQRQISRELNIDRKTIRRYLREYNKKKSHLLEGKDPDKNLILIPDIVSKPKYNSSMRKKVKLTDEIIAKIKFYLDENRAKRATGRSKQVKAKIDIWQALVEDNYDIGYTTVCNAIREIDREEKEAYIRAEYTPGKVAEFDWGQVKLIIAGKLSVFEMSAFTAAKSNYRDADIYYSQKTESFLDAHANFFEEVGGVYSQIVYDNTKVAVAKFVGNNEKKPTDELLKLSIYYNFNFRFCNAGCPNEKGHVEKSVEYIRRKVFCRRDEFDSYEQAREYLKKELVNLNLMPQGLANGRTAADMLADERPHLLPKPPKYDTARISEPRVNKYSCVAIDTCYYSVPDSLVGEFVFAKTYTDKILCYYENVLVAEHKRAHGRSQWQIDICHFVKTLTKKPGAIASSVALSQATERLLNIYNRYYRGLEKSFIELVGLISKIGIDKVEAAIDEIENISIKEVTTDKIVTICQRMPLVFNDKTADATSEIEKSSRKILSLYGDLLNKKEPELVEVV
ncbi:MAG: IS21 family transposase [Actinobacteria bacterium]|nr:IS21 family transposase [Actinomycetota bacterium]